MNDCFLHIRYSIQCISLKRTQSGSTKDRLLSQDFDHKTIESVPKICLLYKDFLSYGMLSWTWFSALFEDNTTAFHEFAKSIVGLKDPRGVNHFMVVLEAKGTKAHGEKAQNNECEKLH